MVLVDTLALVISGTVCRRPNAAGRAFARFAQLKRLDGRPTSSRACYHTVHAYALPEVGSGEDAYLALPSTSTL